MKDGVSMEWKWCSKCEHRRTDVCKESDGVVMGYDICKLLERLEFAESKRGWRSVFMNDERHKYIYPSMDSENRQMLESCPFYTEAMVEQLNRNSSK